MEKITSKLHFNKPTHLQHCFLFISSFIFKISQTKRFRWHLCDFHCWTKSLEVLERSSKRTSVTLKCTFWEQLRIIVALPVSKRDSGFVTASIGHKSGSHIICEWLRTCLFVSLLVSGAYGFLPRASTAALDVCPRGGGQTCCWDDTPGSKRLPSSRVIEENQV